SRKGRSDLTWAGRGPHPQRNVDLLTPESTGPTHRLLPIALRVFLADDRWPRAARVGDMTPERQAEFLALISEGESIGGACRRLKISNSRVNTFRSAHRDFDTQVRQAFADSAVKRQEIFRQRSTTWRPRSGVPSRPVEGKKVPAIVEPFLAELAHGASVTAAAEYAGVSRAMVFRWRRDDLELARRWEEAVQMG